MSQAVSAPITGALAFTGGKSAKATDNSTEIAGQNAPSRRAVLAGMALMPAAPALAAPALGPHERDAWDRAHHEYRRRRLLMEAYYDLGPMNWANEGYLRHQMVKDVDPAGFQAAAVELRNQEDQSDRYYAPVRDAARTLMRLPAPDLDAVAVKMALHKADLEGTADHELAWACISADLKRLAA